MIQILAPIDNSPYGIVEYMLSTIFLSGIILSQFFVYLFDIIIGTIKKPPDIPPTFEDNPIGINK